MDNSAFVKSPFYIFCPIILLAACTSNPVEIPELSIKIPQTGVTTETLNSASTAWGSSREELQRYMKGYEAIHTTDSEILVYRSKSNVVSYQLINNQLGATSILFYGPSHELNFDDTLAGFSLVGELSGSKIYQNPDSNCLATVMKPVDSDNSYSAISFAPLQTELYDDYEIKVSTNSDVEIDGFNAYVSGNVYLHDGAVEVGFIYGLDYTLPVEICRKKSTTGSGNFSMKLTGLADNETYYYKAYALVDDCYYWGETRSFKTGNATYTINGKTFKMIKVESGNGTFSIMQTELPPNAEFTMAGNSIMKLNQNDDVAIIKTEFRYFLNDLIEKTGMEFRLPTKSEWQFAAKGGIKSEGYTYSGSNNIADVAWYSSNSGNSLHDVALKSSNELQIFDMSGNYAEVCNDSGDLYYIDGVICGGNYSSSAGSCKSTSYVNGETSGSIPDSKIKEKNAFDCRKNTIRLVYSHQ